MTLRPLNSAEFDAFVHPLDYPVFIVTAHDGRERAGCLVGFATQVGIDPPRLLVCLSRENHTLDVAVRAELLAVHLLSTEDHAIAAHFGGQTGDDVDKFADVRWHPGPDGVPLLDDLPRHVIGRVLERLPFGDHVGHLLAPVTEQTTAQTTGGEAVSVLTLHQVDDVEPGHPA